MSQSGNHRQNEPMLVSGVLAAGARSPGESSLGRGSLEVGASSLSPGGGLVPSPSGLAFL